MTGETFDYTHICAIDLPSDGLWDLEISLDISMSCTLDDYTIDAVSIVSPMPAWISASPGAWASMATGETDKLIACKGNALRDALADAIKNAVYGDDDISVDIYESVQTYIANNLSITF